MSASTSPTSIRAEKRTHGIAFANRDPLTTVLDAVGHLKESSKPMALEELFRWLSLPVDQAPVLTKTILTHHRVMVNDDNPNNIIVCYRPLNPVKDAGSLLI
jgi:hypothetical protein